MTECESLALRIVADDLPRNRSVGRIGVSEVRKDGSWIASDLFVRLSDLRRDPIGMGTQRSANQTRLSVIGYGMLVGKGHLTARNKLLWFYDFDRKQSSR